jgi:hypothetical protein
MLLQRRSFLEDLKKRVPTACPLSAICINALAARISITVYKTFAANGYKVGFGISEKRGRRRGAYNTLLVYDGNQGYR